MEQSVIKDAIVIMAKVKSGLKKDGDKFVETGKLKLDLTVLKNSTSIDTGEVLIVSSGDEFNGENGVSKEIINSFKFGDKISLVLDLYEFNNKVTRKIRAIKFSDGTLLSADINDTDLPF